MRLLALLIAAMVPAGLQAQAIVASPAPDRVSVTVYRDTSRGLEPLNLQWLNGYALVSEVRRVRLPAGESELRFEGVTSGIVPQSAIVTGLGPAVLEKNRDARLLSPGALIDAYLGERLRLRRTSKETGEVREQDAIVRATADGIVLQTAEGIEALRCTGLNETLLAPEVPKDLSAKPTLSVRVRSPEPIETDVTLSYLTSNFDWQANYIAELSPSGDRMSLFAWMTLANGDDTGLANASTQAVAGKLNYERAHVEPPQVRPIHLNCWPQGTTSDIPLDAPPPPPATMAPPPPPPPPAPERGGEDIVVTGASIVAQQERLGDVRLYRIPIAVTVAPKSQKQVALMQQPSVKVEQILRLRVPLGEIESSPIERLLVTRNRSADGLGLPLPAGKVALFRRLGDRRVLVGEGSIDDFTVGEKVEVRVGTAPGARVRQTVVATADGGGYLLTLTNDSPETQTVEIELPLGARAVEGGRLTRRDGWMLWKVEVPANGSVQLRYRAES